MKSKCCITTHRPHLTKTFKFVQQNNGVLYNGSKISLFKIKFNLPEINTFHSEISLRGRKKEKKIELRDCFRIGYHNLGVLVR